MSDAAWDKTLVENLVAAKDLRDACRIWLDFFPGPGHGWEVDLERFVLKYADHTLNARILALEANQRTPGTVEVCGLCGYGKTYQPGVVDCELEMWAECVEADCPIVSASMGKGRF